MCKTRSVGAGSLYSPCPDSGAQDLPSCGVPPHSRAHHVPSRPIRRTCRPIRLTSHPPDGPCNFNGSGPISGESRRGHNPPRPLASKRVDLISNKLIKIKEKKPPLYPLQGPRGGRCSFVFPPRPPLESQQGTGRKSQGFGSSAQKLNHPFFVIAACFADWTPGVCAKTARKRQIGPNGLLALTVRVFSNRCVLQFFAVFGYPS